MDKKGILFEEFMRQLKELPPEYQQAVCLLVQHLKIITQLPWEPMSLEEKERRISEALQREDYLCAAIVEYKWLEQERGN